MCRLILKTPECILHDESDATSATKLASFNQLVPCTEIGLLNRSYTIWSSAANVFLLADLIFACVFDGGPDAY